MTGGVQQRPQGSGCASLAPDHFANITFGDFELDHAVVEEFDKYLIWRVNQ